MSPMTALTHTARPDASSCYWRSPVSDVEKEALGAVPRKLDPAIDLVGIQAAGRNQAARYDC
jgi:hypothetical protein